MLSRDPATAALILAALDRAFDGVALPGPDSKTLRQAEACDDYDACGREGDFQGRWQDLPDSELLECQWALPHLDDQGIHFYLPAHMSLALRVFASGTAPGAKPDGSEWIFESLEYTLGSPGNGDELREYARMRFSRFDHEQRLVTARFVAWYVDDDDILARWTRLAEAESNGPRDDWWIILSATEG